MARSRGERGETSLDAAMRQPAPDVVVLDFVEEDAKVKDTSDPKKDLYLSTNDGYALPSRLHVRFIGAVQLNLRSCANNYSWPNTFYCTFYSSNLSIGATRAE